MREWCLSADVMRSLPNATTRATLLYLAALETASSTITDLAATHCCTRRTMTAALSVLCERGFLVVSGLGYVRTFSVPEKRPHVPFPPAICAQGTHLSLERAPSELMCAQRAHLSSEIVPETTICAQRTHIAADFDSTAEGDSLLGTLINNTKKNTESVHAQQTIPDRESAPASVAEVTVFRAEDDRTATVRALREIEGPLFSLFGSFPSGDQFELLVDHWRLTRESTGRFPTAAEVISAGHAARSWILQKAASRGQSTTAVIYPKNLIHALAQARATTKGPEREATTAPRYPASGPSQNRRDDSRGSREEVRVDPIVARFAPRCGESRLSREQWEAARLAGADAERGDGAGQLGEVGLSGV